MHHQKLLPERILEFLNRIKKIKRFDRDKIKQIRPPKDQSSWEFIKINIMLEYIEPNHDSKHRSAMLIVREVTEKDKITLFSIVSSLLNGKEETHVSYSGTAKGRNAKADAVREHINEYLPPELKIPIFAPMNVVAE